MPYPSETLASNLLSKRGESATDQPITQLMATALANPDVISLAAGFVDNATLPIDAVGQSVASVLSDAVKGPVALQYGTTPGLLPLRQEIARRNFGADAAPLAEQMLLTAGSNQLLHLVSECLYDEGDIVLCAAPTYFVFLGMLQDMGVVPYGVEADADGLSPENLDATLSQLADAGKLDRVKSVYVIPYYDNPAGATIPSSRRRELLEVFNRWCLRSPMTLLVDNAYRDLRYAGEDVPSFTELGADPETTIESGTFSKNFAPGIRVGWGLLPQWLLDPMNRKKSGIDFGSAHFNQHVMLEALQSGTFDNQVSRLREAYSAKLQAMLAACETWLGPIDGVEFRSSPGGLYVWVELPKSVSASMDAPLWQACVENGVLYVPGEFCFPSQGAPIQKNSLRLSFGVQTAPQIHRGIELLADALNKVSEVASV